MNKIFLGDCLDVLKTLSDASVDSVVTDCPYGLGTREPTIHEIIAYLQGEDLDHGHDFMGHKWSVPSVAVWLECFRVLKPGGHLISFGGTRTWDLISLGLRAAGFENRDTIASNYGPSAVQWIQGQGFPKSANILKNMVKHEVPPDVAAEYEGLGTALKPSWEPALIFRKPITEKTVAKQVLKTGTGAINIDGCRVRAASDKPGELLRNNARRPNDQTYSGGPWRGGETFGSTDGRWPSNRVFTHSENCTRVGSKKVDAPVINRFVDGAKPFGNGAGHAYESEQRGDAEGKEEVAVYNCQEGCPVKTLDEQSGVSTSLGGKTGGKFTGTVINRSNSGFNGENAGATAGGFGDTGGASRFFPQFDQDPSYECEEGCPIKALDDQSGVLKTSGGALNRSGIGFQGGSDGNQDYVPPSEGGASRFFPQFEQLEAPFMYATKVSKRERDAGLPKGTNTHCTVKPIKLMRWLVRLVTPKGGTVLDPYAGSGSTLVAAMKEGFNFIGIERDPEFHRIAEMRVEANKPQRDIFDDMED